MPEQAPTTPAQTTDRPPTKLDTAIKQVEQVSPEAAKTLRSIAQAQSGDAKGAIQALQAEGATVTSIPQATSDINSNKAKAIQQLARGDIAGAIKTEEYIFASQLGSAARDKENLFRDGPIPDPDKAKAVETTLRTVVGDANGDKVVAAFEKFTATANAYEHDMDPRNPLGKFKAGIDAVKAVSAAKEFNGMLSDAVPALITGGDTPQGDPKSQPTPNAAPDKTPGRSGPN
jgi:hypothetical protein